MNISRYRAPVAVLIATALAGGAGFLFGPARHPAEAQWTEGSAVVAPSGSTIPDFAALAEVVTPAVVRVESTKDASNDVGTGMAPGDMMPEPFRRFFDMPGWTPQRRGMEPPVAVAGGSGFLISHDGYIATNNHVVENARDIRVWLSDGRSYEAELVGADPTTDVAVIRIHAEHLPALTWGSSKNLRVGDWVMAVGNPGVQGSAPLDYTVTSGIVSAKGRPLDVIRRSLDDGMDGALAGYAVENFIQTDAVINPGNSGGPLVDSQGRVVGITSAILSTDGYFQGYGFAIPSDLAAHVAQNLIEHGSVRRAWLGLSMTAVTPEDAEVYGLPSVQGALVQSVADQSPASKAGLREGDVIVSLAGEPIRKSGQLQERVAEHDPGDHVALGIYRGGHKRTLEAVLGEMPMRETAARATSSSRQRTAVESRLGIRVAALTPDLAARFGLDEGTSGLVVTSVDPLGPTGRKGVAPGLRLAEVAGHQVTTEHDLADALAEVDTGHAITLRFVDGSGQGRLVNVRPR